MREASKIGREVGSGMPLAKDDKQHTYTADPLIAAIVTSALETHPHYREMAHRQPDQDGQATAVESAGGNPIAPQ